MKHLVLVGMGPGVSMGVARRFGMEGFKVWMLGRNVSRLESYQRQLEEMNIRSQPVKCDAADAISLKNAINKAGAEAGAIDVLHYNVALGRQKHILDETPESLTADFKVSCLHALEAVKCALPFMETQQKATVLFTGGGLSLFPHPDFGSLSLGKAGLRNLAFSLNKALKDRGVKVGLVTIQGAVSDKDPRFNPDRIAQEFWKVYTDDTQTEIQF